MNKKLQSTVFFILILCFFNSCQKLVSISPPVGELVATQVFASDAQATSAAAGMYSGMINVNLGFASSGISVLTGMSADELVPFNQYSNNPFDQFQENQLTVTNGLISNIWDESFVTIYQANAIIQGLQNNVGVHDSVKNELTGEAEFVRAFCNFYLVNLYGEVPLVTTIKYQQTSLLPRTPVAQVYQAIIIDLKDAQSKMASDYSVGGGQRIIPNKWAATALLARVYLYIGDWQDAVIQSSLLINNTGLYSLVSNLKGVFLTNSREAIWQLQQSNIVAPWFNITPEAELFIPAYLNTNVSTPFAYVTTSLLNAFEPGDVRKATWFDSTLYNGTEYYFPFKYQSGPTAIQTNGPYSEYYMVFRLGEQFLIRAEAEAQLGQGSSAVTDLNIIRGRALLPPYSGSTAEDSLLNAILHERQVELFVEWGHRWLDLKRSGRALTILSADKGFSLNSTLLLYPIPSSELVDDPNLIQNPGY